MKGSKKYLVVLLSIVFLLTSSMGAIVFADESADLNTGADSVNEQQLSDDTDEDVEDEIEDEEEDIEDEEKDEIDDEDKAKGKDKNKDKMKDKGSKKIKDEKNDSSKDKDKDEDDDEDDEDDEDKEKKDNEEWKAAKAAAEALKDAAEAEKDALELKKDELEKKYEEAKESGNATEQELAELKALLEDARLDFEAKKQETRNYRNQMKEITRNRYTFEELEQLQQLARLFEENDDDISVIPVENILFKKRDAKFDTPPVIKHGRTLIPVRAISEGFGASVEWNADEKAVTIVKGEGENKIEIILKLESNIAYVNGKEVEIDVPPGLMNNRTMVPLRFIAENLGLKVDWDSETGIIEIEEP